MRRLTHYKFNYDEFYIDFPAIISHLYIVVLKGPMSTKAFVRD